jgi:hypothetical protein
MAKNTGGRSPVEISKALKGIGFPASKDELIEHAQRNKAEKSTLEVLQALPGQKFATMADVQKGVGEVE